MGRWIVIAALAVVVAVGLGAYFRDGDWRNNGPGHGSSEVVTTASGQTIVIERDRHFFPFFIFVPFLIFGFFWAFGPRRCRDNGTGGSGSRQQSFSEWQHWLDEWHRRQHDQSSHVG